jgi:hypothetical protein
VFNLKWSALSAALGFVLSLLLSLVSGAGMFSLLRALIFGAGFFVLSSLLYWMVKRFLPEILSSENDDIPSLDLGSRVDISLDSDDDISSLAAALTEETGGNQGNSSPEFGISGVDPSAAALDLDGETGYTNKDAEGEKSSADGFVPLGSFFPAETEKGSAGLDAFGSGSPSPPSVKAVESSPAEAVLPAEGIDSLDVLPALDGVSRTFLSSPMDDLVPKRDGGSPVSVAFPGVERNSITPEEAEEFRGREKDSALAIQTILKRD